MIDRFESPESLQESHKERLPRDCVKSFFDDYSEEELVSRSRSCMMDAERMKVRMYLLQKIGLTKNEFSDDELSSAIKDHIEKYRQKVERVKDFVPQHLTRTRMWLEKIHATPKQDPEGMFITVEDDVLSVVVDGRPPFDSNMSHFSPERNHITLDWLPNMGVLAHEYIHAMSHDPSSQTTGFRRMHEIDIIGPVWLDEGMAMIGQFRTYGEDESAVDDLYMGYHRTVYEFMNALGIDEEFMFKAYFGMHPYRAELEKRIEEFYGVSIDDLKKVFIGYSEESLETAAKILRKEPVTLRAKAGTHADKRNRDLAGKFGHVTAETIPG